MIFSVDQKEQMKHSLVRVMSGFGSLPIFMCVGVDNVIQDSLGPMVGELLKSKYSIPTYVYGGLDYNISATNLEYVKHFIEVVHSGSPIFVIDASIGEDDIYGKIKLVDSGVYPAGLTRNNPRLIGDFSILGIVGVIGIKNKIYLNKTRLDLVLNMAESIAEVVASAVCEMNDNIITHNDLVECEYMHI